MFVVGGVLGYTYTKTTFESESHYGEIIFMDKVNRRRERMEHIFFL